MEKKISFIIPARNEALNIIGVIESINQNALILDGYEIIVVDNGSTDDTVAIAEKSGAKVLSVPGVNVGALRNRGAEKSKYDHLVFLDADVILTSKWKENISSVLDTLTDNNYSITGSICDIGSQPGWIEKCWWGKAKSFKRVRYINSGHMIVNRKIFNKIGAFNETLKSGEDSELCQRAREIQVNIINEPELKVIHEGYPKTLSQFFKRERWHGLGDCCFLRDFLKSKPAIIATMQVVLLVVAIVLAVSTVNLGWLFLYPTFILPVSLSAAYNRCFAINYCLLTNTTLYFIYFWARAFSLYDTLKNLFILRISKESAP